MTAGGKALKEAHQREPKSQWKGLPLTGDIPLCITLYFGTKRRSDLDSFDKPSHNALTGIAYENDSQIAEFHLRRDTTKGNPRIHIEIDKVQ